MAITLLGVTAAILAWAISKHFNLFPGNESAVSALSRIYVGDPAFSHISFPGYCENLFLAARNNLVEIFFLVLAWAIIFYIRDFSIAIILVPLSLYLFLSPLAISPVAASLGDHYGYPLLLSYFICLGMIPVCLGKLCAHKNGNGFNRHTFSISVQRPVTALTLTTLTLVCSTPLINRFNQSITILLPRYTRNAETILVIRDLSFIRNKPQISLDLMRYSILASYKLESLVKKLQARDNQPIILVDHRLAALLPHQVEYCNVIMNSRRKENDICSKPYPLTKQVIYLTLQPSPSLDEALVKNELEKYRLYRTRSISIARINGVEMNIGIHKRRITID